jgi:hypothetical protein
MRRVLLPVACSKIPPIMFLDMAQPLHDSYTIYEKGKISVAPRMAVDFPDGRSYTTPQESAGREVTAI